MEYDFDWNWELGIINANICIGYIWFWTFKSDSVETKMDNTVPEKEAQVNIQIMNNIFHFMAR